MQQKPDFKISLNISIPVEIQVFNEYTLLYTNSALVDAIRKADGEEYKSITDILEQNKFLTEYIDRKQVLEFQANSYRQKIQELQAQLASVESEIKGAVDGSLLPPITGRLDTSLSSSRS